MAGRIIVAWIRSRERLRLVGKQQGPRLPDQFDPAACVGLGMLIIRSLVKKISGDFRFGRGADNQGARFVVRFS